jgi:hypothetical protein
MNDRPKITVRPAQLRWKREVDMAIPVTPFAVQAGEGTTLVTPNMSRVKIKAHTRNTNGSMTVLELLSRPKDGPPLHNPPPRGRAVVGPRRGVPVQGG